MSLRVFLSISNSCRSFAWSSVHPSPELLALLAHASTSYLVASTAPEAESALHAGWILGSPSLRDSLLLAGSCTSLQRTSRSCCRASSRRRVSTATASAILRRCISNKRTHPKRSREGSPRMGKPVNSLPLTLLRVRFLWDWDRPKQSFPRCSGTGPALQASAHRLPKNALQATELSFT